MSDPRCSVVIPCYRQAGSLRSCIGGLAPAHQGDGFEVIVIDGGCEAASASAGLVPGMRVIRGKSRLWPGAARNLGARAARGEFVLFLDADCVPEPGWVRASSAGLQAGARLVGGPVLDLLPTHPIAASDNLLQFVECGAGRPEGRATRLPSCNLGIRRADFDALGGFAEVAAAEDILFSQVALSRWPDGFRFLPAMRVRHLGRTELQAFLTHQTWFGYSRGRLRNDLTPRQQRLAASPVMLPAVVAKRLGYILGRTAAWNPRGLARAVGLSPLLIMGLSAYAIGLRRGLRGGPAPGEPW
jgi:glycosyltransferase involved in cell wall biosynthesis